MKKFVKKTAFSIAEGMITLLIVSLALAAAAPIMSKSIKNNQNITNINGASKWADTLGGHITREYNKVGIGVPANEAPQARLEVRGNSPELVRLTYTERVLRESIKDSTKAYNASKVAFALYNYNNKNNLVQALRILPEGDIVIRDMDDETDEGWRIGISHEEILTKGRMIFRVDNDPRKKVVEVRNPQNPVDGKYESVAWIKANGDSSFSPHSEVIQILGTECPDPTIWDEVKNTDGTSITCKIGNRTCIYCKRK